MAAELFGRYLRVKAGGLDASGLNASFHIVKSLDPNPNGAEIRIYNLKESNRQLLHNLPTVPVEVILGYTGLNPINPIPTSVDAESLLFKGDAREVFSTKEGPDWVTVLRIGDGLKACKNNRLLKSYKEGIPIKTIITDIINAFQVDNKDALAKIAAGAYTNSMETVLSNYVVSGQVNKELEKILKKANLSHSVQDNVLTILGDIETTNTDAIVLSPQTGLIGSPEPGVGEKKKNLLKIKALIQPKLSPGKKIILQSARFKGVYKIHKAVYQGSAFDNNWYVDIEASAIL